MARRSTSGKREGGFTVAELLVVLLIIGLIAAIAVPNVSGAITRAKETALLENLSVMRQALDDYFADKGAYPGDLNALVEQRYIRFIPDDPVSDAGVAWETITGEGGTVMNVQSSSEEVGTNEVPYSEW